MVISSNHMTNDCATREWGFGPGGTLPSCRVLGMPTGFRSPHYDLGRHTRPHLSKHESSKKIISSYRKTKLRPTKGASGRVERCSGCSAFGCLPAAAAPDLRRQACRHLSSYGQTMLRLDERMRISSNHITNDCPSRAGASARGSVGLV